MEHSFGSEVCNMSFLRSRVSSETAVPAIHVNDGAPFIAVFTPVYAKKPALVLSMAFALVLKVSVPIRFAEIRNTVVRFVAVNVVNFLRRPLAINVVPSQSVSGIGSALQHDKHVSLSQKAYDSAVMFWTSPNSVTDKYARFRIVIDHGTQLFERYQRSRHNRHFSNEVAK